MSALVIVTMHTRSAMFAIRRWGSPSTRSGSTGIVASSIAIAVITPQATTTCQRKRVAAKATGTIIQESEGLSSPPFSAVPTAMKKRTTRVARATTISGFAERAMRFSTKASSTSTGTNTANVMNPVQGATRAMATSRTAAQSVRAERTRSPASSRRARSISVGHRNELIRPIPHQSAQRAPRLTSGGGFTDDSAFLTGTIPPLLAPRAPYPRREGQGHPWHT